MSLDTVILGEFSLSEESVPLIYSETNWEFDQIGLDGVFGLGLAKLEGVSPDPGESLPSWLLPQLWECEFS